MLLESSEHLIKRFPIHSSILPSLVLFAFEDVFRTKIGTSALSLANIPLAGAARGSIIGSFFEAIFLDRLHPLYPGKWRSGTQNHEPDLVYIDDPLMSMEIKTTSTKTFSGHVSAATGKKKVVKPSDSYYLLVNYTLTPAPKAHRIRFGFLPGDLWIGSTGVGSHSTRLDESQAQYFLMDITP